MIDTLLITVLVEGVLVLAYCIWQKKPLLSIFVTSLAANVVTQSVLWVVLNIFFQHYLATLLITEILIWVMEGIALFGIRKNHLRVWEALPLSLVMNLSSFGVGIWLPV